MYIYKITNKINNKIYIGQTQKSILERWAGHVYKSKKLKTPLANAINKYGVSSFEVKLIMKAGNLEELSRRESFCIRLYQSDNRNKGYNTMSGNKNYVMPDSVRKKISKTLKGRKLTDEQRARHVKSIRDRIQKEGQHINAIKALRKSTDESKKPIRCIITGKTYNSVTEAARDLNTSTSNICKNLTKQTSFVKGCCFEYVSAKNSSSYDSSRKKGKKILFINNTTGSVIVGYNEIAKIVGLNRDQVLYRLCVKKDYSLLSDNNLSLFCNQNEELLCHSLSH